MGPEQICRFGFVLSVDMTAAPNDGRQTASALSPEADLGVYRSLMSTLLMRHQFDGTS